MINITNLRKLSIVFNIAKDIIALVVIDKQAQEWDAKKLERKF